MQPGSPFPPPRLVCEADARFFFDWSKWPVPEAPSVPEHLEPWFGHSSALWRVAIKEAVVDYERSSRLAAHDCEVSAGAGRPPWMGCSWGMPFNLIDAVNGPTVKVWDMSRPWTEKPITMMPYSGEDGLLRREGDPAGGSDCHYYAVDTRNHVLVEAIQLQHGLPLASLGQTTWYCSYNGGGRGISRWQTNTDWRAQGQPGGVVAAGVPQFPMISRWEEIERGRISHALFASLPNYANSFTGFARHTDGTNAAHPVRAGERLRLKSEVIERFPKGSCARILAEALHEYGLFCGDKNGGARASIALTQDRRWDIGTATITGLSTTGLSLRLVDFEVVIQTILTN